MKKPKEKRLMQVLFDLDDPLIPAIEKIANLEDRSIAWMLKKLVKEAINQRGHAK